MFNSPVLDLVILLSFTYFIGSIIISAINESISGAFRLRQQLLQQAIENMFFDTEWQQFVKNKLTKSPHIKALMRAQDRYPAYIPSKNFILAVIQELGPDFPKQMVSTIKSSSLPADFKQVLQDLAVEANNDFEKFKSNTETFFNNAMDRTAGWYKKRIRLLLLIIGGVLATALNLDTFRIANDALKNKTQLQATADQIGSYLSNVRSNGSEIIILDKDSTELFRQSVLLDTTTSVQRDSSFRFEQASNTQRGRTELNFEKKYQGVRAVVMNYQDITGYHLGYTTWSGFVFDWLWYKDNAFKFGFLDSLFRFLSKFIGILITAFALQISANYWFDLMNKVVNIRAVGRRPNGEQKK